jgi:hypothetical protein
MLQIINRDMQNLHQPAVKLVKWRRWIVFASLCALYFFQFRPCKAQSSVPVAPADIEATSLYNFGKFIDWPIANPNTTPTQFSICIVGKDDFGSTLDTLVQNDTVKGHKIITKRLQTIADADSCQILFLAYSEKSRVARDLDALKEKPILTVSTIPGFLDRGGMIEFIVQDNRVRFAVNLASADRVHLVFSSELLKVAAYVNSKPAKEGQ